MNLKSTTIWKAITICIVFGFVLYFLIVILPSPRKPSAQKTAPGNPQNQAASHSGGLPDLPKTYLKDHYTPVIAVKFKVKTYQEIPLQNAEALDPRVSPDGTRIVLTLKTDKQNKIALVDLTDNRVTVPNLEFDDCLHPSWNAAGDRIVFIGIKKSVSELYTYDLENGKLTQITKDPSRKKAWPRFSPYPFDQHYRIAYASEKNGRKDIWWVRESGEYDQPLTLPLQAVENYKKAPYWSEMVEAPSAFLTKGGDYPEWSPSGHILLYRQNGNTSASLFYSYYTWWQEGTLPLPKSNHLLVWAPNQCSFLEYDPHENKAFIVSRDALQKSEILTDKALTSPPYFFPDGQGLVYTFRKDGKSVLALAPHEEPLGDIVNLWMYAYTQSQKEKLLKNDLVFLHSEYDQIYNLYDTELYNESSGPGRPYLVTSDAVLETFYSAFSALLSYAERQELSHLLSEFAARAQEAAQTRKASTDVRLWFSVGLALIDPNAGTQPLKSDLPGIQNELNRIKQASQTHASLFNKKVNYTDFFIRGKYERDSDLQNYFRALKWFQAFRFNWEDSQDQKWIAEILAIINDPEVATYLEKINLLLKDMIGESRYFSPLTLKAWKNGEPLPAPVLQSPWLQMENAFKLLPAFYTLDAFIFDELITHTDRPESVGTALNPRVLPLGMDIMATLGSEEAKRILLDEFKEGRFENFENQLDRARDKIKGFPQSIWEQTLYLQWLDLFQVLLNDPEKAPAFTKTKAWKRKQLNTALGSWVGLRYETVAYVEQAMAEAGEGGYETINVGKPRGYVEPNPLFFRKLDGAFGKIAEKFEQIIRDPDLKAAVKERADKYRGHLQKLELIAQKELANETLTDEEYSEILYIGRVIEYFILITNSLNSNQNSLANPEPVRKVVDVQAAPDGTRLYEALGFANEINVVVPYYGKRQIVKGPVYSYYEFRSTEQWTNEKWRQQKEYRLPVWIAPYYDGRSERWPHPGDLDAPPRK
ncbi:MAG: DUF3160 domain-containing protein [Desulfobacteraceae bacterium]|nr:MAG: DUF3160 domain-containing protein [Desulfobacteraceae bacterium]